MHKAKLPLEEIPEYSWFQTSSELQTQIDGRLVKKSLKPTSIFYQHLENSSAQNLRTCLQINIQKPLKYEPDLGWTWHKSSNLPLISVRLEIFSQKDGLVYKSRDQISVELYATKMNSTSFRNESQMFLEDVGLKGVTKIELKNNYGCFSGIKFNSTSYNNEGAKFSLLVVAYQSGKNQQSQQVICSAISSPIFVDSRKSARDYHEQKFLSHVEMFLPSVLQKNYEMKIGKGEGKREIENSIDGLFHYLTAANIRNKIKHPLYLAIKFSAVFNIFCHVGTQIREKQINLLQILKKFQKKLVKQLPFHKNKAIIKERKKIFAIVVDPPKSLESKNKLLSCFEYLNSKSILVETNQAYLQKGFVNLKALGNLAQVYQEFYDSQGEIFELENEYRNKREELRQENIFSEDDQQKNQLKDQPVLSEQKNQNILRPSEDHIYNQSEEQSLNIKQQSLLRREQQFKETMRSKYRGDKFIYSEKEEQKNKTLKNESSNTIDNLYQKRKSAFQFVPNAMASPPSLKNALDKKNEEPLVLENPFLKNNTFQKNTPSVSSSNNNSDNSKIDKLTLLKYEVLKNEIYNQLDLNNALMKNIINKNETLKMKVEVLFESMKNTQTQPSEEMRWSSQSSSKQRQSN